MSWRDFDPLEICEGQWSVGWTDPVSLTVVPFWSYSVHFSSQLEIRHLLATNHSRVYIVSCINKHCVEWQGYYSSNMQRS